MIIFVGPLPPPVHGFAVINQAMLAQFQSATRVSVFNRAPGAQAAGRLFWSYLRALWSAPVDSLVYLALSGGWGQLKDLPYLLAARLLRRRLLVHHHSCADLRSRPWHARWALALLRQAQHIVLCDCMATLLALAYRIPRPQIRVLSNAAFLLPPVALAPHSLGEPLRLGFLSNISAEKGIWAYFDLIDALHAHGVAVEGVVAGPVAADIEPRFEQECARRPHCRHLGAVYGPAKQAFFEGIDVLAFPTRYANEAEPVTILEALSAGVPVVANARGCIAEMLPPEAGMAWTSDGEFASLAAAQLQAWLEQGPQAWARRRQAAQHVFAHARAQHAEGLAQIVAQAVQTGPETSHAG